MYREEIFCGIKYIELDKINKVSKSICKITTYSDKKKSGTGFFMLLSFNYCQFKCDPLRCLVTNYHVLSKELIGKDIKLTLHNNNVIKLSLDKNIRNISFFKPPIDITVIEINDQDFDIIKKVGFLNLDMNFISGYNEYCGEHVFSLGFPEAKTMRYGPGKIIAVDNYEFKHNIPTNEGSSGSPICLINNSLVI